MSYQDSWAICTQCGNRFVFRIEDQRRQAEQGQQITPPSLCPKCQGGETPAYARPRPVQEGKPQTVKKPVLGPGPHEGKVKWYDDDKGYGFISQSDGQDIFFHRTGIASQEKPDLPDGTPVTYCIEQSEKGPQAVDVERLDPGD